MLCAVYCAKLSLLTSMSTVCTSTRSNMSTLSSVSEGVDCSICWSCSCMLLPATSKFCLSSARLSCQTRFQSKCPTANGACKRLASCGRVHMLCAPMSPQIRPVSEGLCTVIARERPVTRMCQFMSCQMCRCRKCLVTLGARE